MSPTRAEKEHRIVDEWVDAIVVCACGARQARRTLTDARADHRVHVRESREPVFNKDTDESTKKF